jgi:hypothetical protein
VLEGIIRVGGPTGAGYLPVAAVNGEAWPGAGAGVRDCGGVTCAHPKEGVQALWQAHRGEAPPLCHQLQLHGCPVLRCLHYCRRQPRELLIVS